MGRAECFAGVHEMRTRNPVCGGRTLGTWTSLRSGGEVLGMECRFGGLASAQGAVGFMR